MDRLTSLQSVSVGVIADAAPSWAVPWSRLLPLWRHVVWLLALFAVLAAAVVVRLDVQRLQMDLDRNDRAQAATAVMQQRLQLELDARRRLIAVEGYAATIDAEPVHATVLRSEP